MTSRGRAMERAIALALGALTVLALAGCSTQRVGAAAVIDGKSVETRDLQTAAQAHLEVVPGGDAGEIQRAILQRMIVSAAMDEAAREVGARVGRGRVAAERDQLLGSIGGRRGLIQTLAQQQPPTVLTPQDVDRWVKDRLLFRAIAEEIVGTRLTAESPQAQEAVERANDELRKASERLDVEISPRYGEWDPETGISPLVSGGLSSTAAELADAS